MRPQDKLRFIADRIGKMNKPEDAERLRQYVDRIDATHGEQRSFARFSAD